MNENNIGEKSFWDLKVGKVERAETPGGLEFGGMDGTLSKDKNGNLVFISRVETTKTVKA